MMNQLEWVRHKLKAFTTPLPVSKKALLKLPDNYFGNLEFNDNKTYQVRLSDIERATGIRFDWRNVQLPYKGKKPKAVKAKPMKEVYTFDVYLKSKIRLTAREGKTATSQKIFKELIRRDQQSLSKTSIRSSLINGYGGILKQHELTNISL